MNEFYIRWGITFLYTDSSISLEEREFLMDTATEMYLNSQTRRRVKREEYDGVIIATGKYQTLGVFGGHRFEAKLETNHGKSNLAFLVTEKINPTMN